MDTAPAHPQLPLNLRLSGRRAVVVGAGAVAQRKVRALLAAEAAVVVVAPEVSDEIAEAAVELRRRGFEPADLEGASLAVAATNSRKVNAAVADAANAAGVWVNVADDPARCDFTIPAVLRRGPITVAVTTGAKSPALARRLRQDLERHIGPEYGELAELLWAVRSRMKRLAAEQSDFADSAARTAVSNALVDSPLLEALRDGDPQQIDDLLQTHAGPGFSRAELQQTPATERRP